MRAMNITEYASIFGVTTDTVRRWERNGKIKPYRTNGGHRRFTEEDVSAIDANAKNKMVNYISNNDEYMRRNIIYCRVSHAEHLEELNEQIKSLKMFALGRGIFAELVIEVGDEKGLARPKFKKLVTDMLNKDVATIIVAKETSLISSGFELLESIAKSCSCEIIVVSNM